jgi:hypothetical protein
MNKLLIAAFTITLLFISNVKVSGIVSYAELNTANNFSPSELSSQLDNAESLVTHAKSVFNNVTQNRLFLNTLKGYSMELPFGVAKTIGQKEYTIAVDSIVITPKYAYAVVFTVLQDVQSGRSLSFGAKVTLNEDGGFASDGGRLYLLSDESIDLGQNSSIEFLGTNGQTYVEFDCNGFMGLNAEMNISLLKDVLVLDSDNTQDVTFETEVYFNNFDNWVVELKGLPSFQFKGLEDFTFTSSYLALDRSPSENPTEFSFPNGYDLGADPNIWEGFCLDGLSVTLPEQFKRKGDSNRISFAIDNAVIDRKGFTGKVTASELMTLEQGDMNGWAYSLSKLSITINQSQFNQLGFEGQIVLPVNKEERPFAYTASIDVAQETKYFFSVATVEDVEFPLWGASNVELYSDSRLEIQVADGKFLPEAILSGKMDVSASLNKEENTPDDGASLELAQISFQQLHIASESPYLFLDPANGAFSVGSQRLKQAMAGIPITLSDVGLVNQQIGNYKHVGLRFNLRVNLTGNGDVGKGFGANTTAVIWGQQRESKWLYHNCELQRLELERVHLGPLMMAGYVEFFREDIIYGTGFSGSIDLEIELQGDNAIGLEVAAIFGKKMDEDQNTLLYRYWAVDALANFPKIPIIPALLYANGFGGGASYKMAVQADQTASTKYTTLSGTGYLPDPNTGLGLRSMMAIQGELSGVYNGEVAFEIVFDTDGSVNDVTFSGFVAIASLGEVTEISVSHVKEMASKLEEVSDRTKPALNQKLSDEDIKEELKKRSEDAAILAQWLMRMDFTQKTFSANVGVFVNVADQITGIGEYDNAGTLDILFAPKEWHVYAGTPSDPLGLRVNLLGVEAGSYIVMGSVIPTPRRPNGYTGYWAFDGDVKAGSTKGFGFGSRITLNFDKTGLFFYHIIVGVGYDVLLRNVEGLTCAETGEPFGIKDWYASGMAYMFLDIEAGLEACVNVPYLKCWKAWKSRCWGTRRVCATAKADFTFSASVAINAPNPTNAVVALSVLGKDVRVKVGKTCTF